MATRIPRDIKVPLHECTNFVLHVSQQTIFNGFQKKIIDYTEHKLIKYIATITDVQQKMLLMAMLSDYLNGHVAIAWRKGTPCYLKVTKERT